MAAASSVPFFGLGDTQMQPQGSSLQQNSAPTPAAAAAAPKKKRNQPSNPSPDAEVIALSPRTLLATNRFVCEVCNKGFPREQNLQLHRRGHNLPWKLKQKNPKEARRRVYLCPEPTCVHHDPSRALGDLTGIKKHYSRKHGEKKWKCDKCNKRYAVQSDWKAHSKTCGTREYRCDCGTLFSRRDSFITHRAFCDALARESAQMPPLGAGLYVGSCSMALGLSGAAPQMPAFADQAESSSAAAAATAQFNHIMPSSSGSSMFRSQASASSSFFLGGSGAPSPAQNFSEDGDHSQGGQGSLLHGKPAFHGLMQVQLPEQHQQPESNGNLLNLGFFSGNSSGAARGQDEHLVFLDQLNGSGGSSNAGQGSVISSLGNHLSCSFPSLYNTSVSAGLPQNSATALLLKAAQMGSTSSSQNGPSVLLRAAGFGAGGHQGDSRAAGERTAHETHFHDLIMNSLAGGGGGFSGAAGFGGVDDGKLSTRDFLGVGRGSAMAPPGLHIGALDPAQMK
ncbi:protein indeterminate-domain 5, chloroplastic-like [Phragmites australis]|uniref:protein indeterminate-domain 5, chloroplastic-like n=1 Tax=Phragmites australis TaxID=29695 RepID=UPI002D79424B|nr:protein indeterminate-domain 5, chloroplastic-like [Phragmites australis]XP_062199266.1 protein indeterminate-domain 5, chloroplastic-like [Phragmites australis]XP_062199267.1 protein indeterminate-domain 5, chloroplastic-like [Phragmites australis]XP_062199268.1 protein indeterminate-domain 5, chloroplastic-like [Phragmites australis]